LTSPSLQTFLNDVEVIWQSKFGLDAVYQVQTGII
jgi:hypothetical protein